MIQGLVVAKMWMVRGDSGRLFEEFREKGVVAIGWSELADIAKPGVTREKLATEYARRRPDFKPGTIRSGASQVWRFINEMRPSDRVVTYNPSTRTYLIGTVTGEMQTDPSPQLPGMAILRVTRWDTEVLRDRLSLDTRNALGSTMTLFLVAEFAAAEVLSVADGKSVAPSDQRGATSNVLPAMDDQTEQEGRLLRDLEDRARELIKDRVDKLDWQEMQELVAGILRALGYKTRISPIGPDRGVDIVASPDGLGFENPRIVVEVKHRNGAMGSKEVRSFLGGRHKDDRGLYVSTGGFTKDARYEAERANIPLTLWELDDVVRTLVDYYDKVDSETRLLVPLRRIHWPV